MENKYKQTRKWENACLQTRRSLVKRKKRLQKFSIQKQDKILDLGCGDGLNIMILKKMGISDIVGLDPSAKILEEAKKNNPKVQFVKGVAEKLPFKSKEFDVVLVDSVFHHLLDYDKALKEIRRVLKPNGRLCFIEPHKSIFRSIMDFICERSFSQYIPFLNKRREAYLNEIHLMKHWLSTEDVFYKNLVSNDFKKIFCRPDFLSMVGEFKRA